MGPLLLVTCDRREAGPTHATPTRVRPARPEVFVGEHVVMRLRSAGGRVLLLPPGEDGVALLDLVDGVVITGGSFDIHPRHYGEHVTARLDRVDEDRTTTELALAAACTERNLPLLGLCGGMQALAIALGGTLHQHIAGHEQATDPVDPAHLLLHDHPLLPDAVNSTHHQAVSRPGRCEVIARAPDGNIEAIALPGHRFCIGVQWHPELMEDARLFAGLVSAASGR